MFRQWQPCMPLLGPSLLFIVYCCPRNTFNFLDDFFKGFLLRWRVPKMMSVKKGSSTKGGFGTHWQKGPSEVGIHRAAVFKPNFRLTNQSGTLCCLLRVFIFGSHGIGRISERWFEFQSQFVVVSF